MTDRFFWLVIFGIALTAVAGSFSDDAPVTHEATWLVLACGGLGIAWLIDCVLRGLGRARMQGRRRAADLPMRSDSGPSAGRASLDCSLADRPEAALPQPQQPMQPRPESCRTET